MSKEQSEYYTEFIGFKSLFYFCSLPLRLDSYRGCTYGCLYCFSQRLNNRRLDQFNKIVPANPKDFERLMVLSQNNPAKPGLVASCLQNKVPIHFGSVSDPFQPADAKYRISYQFLEILKRYDYPCFISTKSSLIIKQKYLELICALPVVVQISFSTLNDELAKRIEPNAPLPTERLHTLRVLKEAGIYTVVRLQPFIYPFEKIDEETFTQFANVGVDHLVLEHLRIPTNSSLKSRAKLWNAIGMNMLAEYQKIGIKYSRVSYELNSKVKFNNIILAKELASKHKMTFGSGDNDLHHFSDHVCCCGIPVDDRFNNIYQGHFAEAAFNSLRSGEISFTNIESQWQPTGSAREYINSDCRIDGIRYVKDLLIHKIKNPSSANSPNTFYGIEFENDEYKVNQDICRRYWEICGG
jgi:DNA repair photolyase